MMRNRAIHTYGILRTEVSQIMMGSKVRYLISVHKVGLIKSWEAGNGEQWSQHPTFEAAEKLLSPSRGHEST